MPDPTWKCTLWMNLKAAGWTETYYTTRVDATAATAALNSLVAKRARLLVPPTALLAARISDDAVQRDSLLYTPQGLNYANGILNPDTPWQSYLCRLGSGTTYWRPLYVRGIPAAPWETFPPILDPLLLTWIGDFDSFLTHLTANLWQIKVIDKSAVTSLPRRVRAVATDPGTGIATITTFGAHGYEIGDLISGYYFKGYTPPFGQRVIEALPTTSSFTVRWDPILLPGSTTRAAFVKKLIRTYAAITSAVRERITHRDVGRPFGLQRGRAPGRVRA